MNMIIHYNKPENTNTIFFNKVLDAIDDNFFTGISLKKGNQSLQVAVKKEGYNVGKSILNLVWGKVSSYWVTFAVGEKHQQWHPCEKFSDETPT
jgi:hypothetical protein